MDHSVGNLQLTMFLTTGKKKLHYQGVKFGVCMIPMLVRIGVNMICHPKLTDKTTIFDLDWRSKMLEHTREVPPVCCAQQYKGIKPVGRGTS